MRPTICAAALCTQLILSYTIMKGRVAAVWRAAWRMDWDKSSRVPGRESRNTGAFGTERVCMQGIAMSLCGPADDSSDVVAGFPMT